MVFNLVSKVILRLLWFSITKLSDWLTKLVPLLQPMGIQTKTALGVSNSNWLVVLFTSVAIIIGQSNYFGFGFTTLNWKLL